MTVSPDEACRPLAAYLWGKPIRDDYPADAVEAARRMLAECLPPLRRALLDDVAADLERMAAQYEHDAKRYLADSATLENHGARQWQVEQALTSQQERNGFAWTLRALAKKWRSESS